MLNEELLKKAESGDLESALKVANCYFVGIDVEQDFAKAVAWYNQILKIDPENDIALTNLGTCYKKGLGVEVDLAKAVACYESAIKHNNKVALWHLAECLFEGNGIEQNYVRAIELYTRAARLGDVDSQVKLGIIYRFGEGVEVNHEEANKWFTMAMEKDSPQAFHAMAAAYNNGFGVEKDIPKSTELWKKAAELGHDVAQYITGINYECGDGVEKDFSEALKWYTLSANQKNPDACFRIAQIYDEGINGIEKDGKKAIHYYEIAYRRGHEEATFTLGNLYYNGKCGLIQDQEKALEIWKEGSEAGYGLCSKAVANCYINGTGTTPNIPMAISYLERAKDQGRTDAMILLGMAYDENGIAEQDLEKAAHYYAEAYAAGEPHGAFRLALMYENGKGVEEDSAKAFELYTCASNEGHSGATVKVGYFYYAGIATEKNVAKAVEYFKKAKAMGDPRVDDLLAMVYSSNAIGDGIDPKEKFEFNYKRANEGDSQAQFRLFEAYKIGLGVDRDDKTAHMWLRKAADNGHVFSQALMGAYEMVKGNYASGVEYWEKASEGGNLKAMHELADVYITGNEAVPANKTRAIELFKKAADAGYADSQFSLGVCFLTGNGVNKDCYEAVKWFEKAATQGSLRAKACLAELYDEGEDIPANYTKAETYYRDLISSGDEDFYDDAVFRLAMMYSTKTKDHISAFPLWKIAAERGDTTAKFNLGFSYYNGNGTAKDDNQALYWWRQAAEEGDETARNNVLALEAEMHRRNTNNSSSSQSNSAQQSGGCYVATAVYGSYDCPEVWTLRRFRDYTLAETWHGRAFIKAYYAISPTIVKKFGQSKWFNRMWKGTLDRMVQKLQNKGVENTPYDDKM